MRSCLSLVPLLLAATASAQSPYKPNLVELKASYTRANNFQDLAKDASLNLTLKATWAGDEHFVYRQDAPGGKHNFILVDCASGAKGPAFDHRRLAEALSKVSGKAVDAERLPFETAAFAAALDSFTFTSAEGTWRCTLPGYEVTKTEMPAPAESSRTRGGARRGGTQNVRVQDGQVQVRNGSDWVTVTKLGDYESPRWATDHKHIVAFHVLPGDRKLVHLLKSSVPGTTRAQLESRIYPQPGDKLDTYEPYVIDPATKAETKVAIQPLMEAQRVSPWGNQIVVSTPVRGYQEWQVIGIDPANATAKVLIDEKSTTFVDISKTQMDLLADGHRIVWQSERDGWSHLYLIDTAIGDVKQIDKGPWVMKTLEQVDEAHGQIWFTALGLGHQDPYHVHECRINVDGSGFVDLTPADGTHTAQWSPNRKYLVDTYSRVDLAPVHELGRASDGGLVCTLEKANIDRLLAKKVRLPERFVAKGRDGKTDIWGVVIRPTNFDSHKKYPVVENIYAGPQDSFVPKAFRPFVNMNRLAELGFIVVQIDGMGTDNRGKAFHDVCWKNLEDAGFPDRILWMQALARKVPQADISRVGIYGTSAGGQNSTGALLFHPEFYKVAVSSCGCHDNRIDKQWWNEQWMGLPVGKEYDDASNITNAGKLKGHLMLFVGEQDRNVPPESTFRLCDALIKAGKNFDMLVIPGADHTDGGPYGEHKRRDYFVKWLLGVDPPDWNN